MSVYPTTEPETIRAALAQQLQTVVPKLTWRQSSRWTWKKDGEIAGTLRNFDLIFGAEVEVAVDDRGVQGAYGGGLEFECPIVCRVSYPLKLAELPRFMGADIRDLTGLLVRLHETVPGMLPQRASQVDRIVPTFEGEDGAYVAEFAFAVRFFADETVQVAS